VALGWGLWEGPARFYFWAWTLPFNSISIHSRSTQRKVALTFRRSTLIYGTDKPSEFLFLREEQRPTVAVSASPQLAFQNATLWHF